MAGLQPHHGPTMEPVIVMLGALQKTCPELIDLLAVRLSQELALFGEEKFESHPFGQRAMERFPAIREAIANRPTPKYKIVLGNSGEEL